MAGVTPGFLILITCLCIAIILVKKEHAIVPLIMAMCFLPSDISINIGPFHLYGVRIIAIIGFIKTLVAPKDQGFCWNKIDKLFISYNLLGSFIYIVASVNTLGAILFKSGVFVDSVLLYYVLRHSINSKKDVQLIIKTFCYCVIVLLPFAMFEFFSAQNLFAFLGRSAIAIRNGEIRATTTFSHAILFGSFAAALVPMFWGGYKAQKSTLTLFAIYCCLFFVVACSSSSPIVALAGGVCLLCFFRWKQYSSLLAKFVLFTAIFIHVASESSLWHFIYIRISVKASSTGLHRYLLTEAAVKEFWNWWLLGYGDVGPQWHLKYWPQSNALATDVTNHFLLEGVRGGFVTMILFIYLCYLVVKSLGALSMSRHEIADQWLWWGFTVMMITHCLTFLSVAYFGQITMLLYLTIAVGSLAYEQIQRGKC